MQGGEECDVGQWMKLCSMCKAGHQEANYCILILTFHDCTSKCSPFLSSMLFRCSGPWKVLTSAMIIHNKYDEMMQLISK